MDTAISTPNRASDAGPDARTQVVNRQALYSILADEFIDGARELERIYRDDRPAEQAERTAKIDELLESLRKMREVV